MDALDVSEAAIEVVLEEVGPQQAGVVRARMMAWSDAIHGR